MGKPGLLGAPIRFQASLPDSGDWLKSNKDASKLTLVVPLEVGAVLTAATARLSDRVLLVSIEPDPSEPPH